MGSFLQTVVAVNGQFESWIEEDVGEVKEVMDERVSDRTRMSVLGEIRLKSIPFWPSLNSERYVW